MNPDHLLDQARTLADPRGRKPRQADLARAVSAAYYALFHAMCGECADQMVGATARQSPTWVLVYRAVEHGTAKTQCKSARAQSSGLHAGVRASADAFIDLQEERHRADYDPSTRYTRAEALSYVSKAERGCQSLRAAPREDRQRLAALVLFRPRP